MSRCLPHLLANEERVRLLLVQDSGAPAWLRAAARDSRRSQLKELNWIPDRLEILAPN